MATIEHFRLSAQEMYWDWLDHREILRKRRFKIFRYGEVRNKLQLDSKLRGKPIDPLKLEEIYGKQNRVLIQTFANEDLPKRNWSKFAVSQAKFRFERDPNMMFFEIGELQKGERGVKIIYLGTGGTDKIPEIGNQIAADSWGFAVLNLKEESE